MEWKIKSSSYNVNWSDRSARRNCSNATGGILLGDSLAKKEESAQHTDEELAKSKNPKLLAQQKSEAHRGRTSARGAVGSDDKCSSFAVVIDDLDEHWTACGLEIGLTTVAPGDQLAPGSSLPEACSFLQPPLWLWTHEGELFDGAHHLKSASLNDRPKFTPDCFRRGDVVTFGWMKDTLQLKVNGHIRAIWPETDKPEEELYPIVGVCGRIKSISIPKEPSNIPYAPTTLGEVVYRGHRAFIHTDKQSVVDQLGILHNSVIEFVSSIDAKFSSEVLAAENHGIPNLECPGDDPPPASDKVDTTEEILLPCQMAL